ncbi:MAG: phosphoglucosamine mutase [Halanaerobiales bacterium]|nr:phosphoglucosamine mutase [Halanaerobiales bacterium]
MASIFGTDGIRGVANKDITAELALKLAKAAGEFLTKRNQKVKKPFVLVGKDTRISGDMLESALIAGFNSVGINVIKLGIISTPAVSFLTNRTDAIGGVMISASHNPIEDNGIKFFNKFGFKLTDQDENEIESYLASDYQFSLPLGKEVGNLFNKRGMIDKYIKHLISIIDTDFSSLKIVLDCANGAAYSIAPQVFNKLNASLITINDQAKGEKINLECGSTKPQMVKEEVLKQHADLGIAYDGDADRLIMVDEKGNIINGDHIMAILALNMIKEGKLNDNTLVTTRYSNLGLDHLINQYGGRVVKSKNGDRYVLKELVNNGYNLGGEKSGHIIMLDYNKTGDGILTSLKVIDYLNKYNNKLSYINDIFQAWPQKLINIEVEKKEELIGNKKIKDLIKQIEKDFKDKGRILIRASGTEPVVRVMLEAKFVKLINKWETKIKNLIKEELN